MQAATAISFAFMFILVWVGRQRITLSIFMLSHPIFIRAEAATHPAFIWPHTRSTHHLATADAKIASMTSSPWNRPRTDVAETLHCLDNPFFIAVPGILDTAKRRHLDSITWNLPDVHRANFELFDKPGDVVKAVGANTGRKSEGRRVGDPDYFFDLVWYPDDRNDRPKSLLAYQFAIVWHVVDDGRC